MISASAGPTRRVEFLVNSLVVGGAERVIEALCRGLPAHGWTAGVGALREAGPIGRSLADEGVELHEKLAPRRYDPLQVLTLCRHLARVRADLVYVLDHSNALLYGRLAARLSGRPQVCAVHRTGRADGRPSLSSTDRQLMRFSRRVIAVSEGHGRYLVDREGVSVDRIAVVPNGVDVERFARASGKRESRTLLGLPQERRLLGVIAALRPEKNHELLLRAVAGEPRLAHCDLVFAGDGTRRDELAALARAMGIDSRVHWLGRVEDVAPVLSALDLMVLPSHPRVETFPLCVLEAMAARVPVVSTNVGSVAEMFGDEGAGALVPPGDVAALREALVLTLLDEDSTRARVELASARVRRHYTEAGMVAATARLLAEVVAR